MYRSINPEVPGGFGEQTELDTTVHPPIVRRLHYEFQGWLGDDLVTSFPCFLVTERLAEAIEAACLMGYLFADVWVTTSYEFHQLYPNRVLPGFRWLQVVGKAGAADFGLAVPFDLVVSAKAYEVLTRFSLRYADVADWTPKAD